MAQKTDLLGAAEVSVSGPPKVSIAFRRIPRPCPICQEPIACHQLLEQPDCWLFYCHAADDGEPRMTYVIHVRLKTQP